KEQELREFCRTNPYVLHFIQQIGDCKIELELEVKDFDQYNSVVDQMRQKFKKYIRNIEVIVIKKQRFKGVPFDIGYIEH
ncbi:MAG: hypothetical protein H6619_06230, partial [Deltaproteobacteria bacterium]|nr:hypothetical protein [Deltaproteobacteria bacterium]